MKDNALSRKEKIMREALLLFAENGYADTSTKIIAQNAGVSEALIFKHFGNKDSLLFHLIKSGRRIPKPHSPSKVTNSGTLDRDWYLFNMAACLTGPPWKTTSPPSCSF